MELDSVYVNVKHKDVKEAHGSQSPGQDPGRAQKQRGRICLVLTTVCLGIICVLLLVFIILQHIFITAERESLFKSHKNTVEEFNQTINRLQDNYTDLTLKKLELETELMKLYEQGKGRFVVSNESKNWSESRQNCRDQGGDLVIINSEEKQRFISSLVKEFVWIGLSDIENEGNMKWVDNSPLRRGFWDLNEPNDAGGDEDCVELNPEHPFLGNWNDIPCSEKKKCVCEN